MLSSCGARLLFGHDKEDPQGGCHHSGGGAGSTKSKSSSQKRAQKAASASSISSTSSGDTNGNNVSKHHRHQLANQQNYVTRATTNSSNLSSDHLEFTFSSGGQSLLVGASDSATTSSPSARNSGRQRISQHEHEFTLAPSGEYLRAHHHHHLHTASSSGGYLAHEDEQQYDEGDASGRQVGDDRRQRQIDDSLPQPPVALSCRDERARGASSSVKLAPLPPPPPHVFEQQLQQDSQAAHRKIKHQSIHQKLQQIYGTRLQEIEQLSNQKQQQQQQQQQVVEMIKQQHAKQRGCSLANGHKPECIATAHQHQHQEQTYDSLVSVSPLAQELPQPPQLLVNQTLKSISNSCGNQTKGDFYDICAHQRQSQPSRYAAAIDHQDEHDDESEDEQGGQDEVCGDIEQVEEEEDAEERAGQEELINERQYWAYEKQVRARNQTHEAAAVDCAPAPKRTKVTNQQHDEEHKRHLASIHYATATAAALLNAAASATAAIASTDKRNEILPPRLAPVGDLTKSSRRLMTDAAEVYEMVAGARATQGPRRLQMAQTVSHSGRSEATRQSGMREQQLLYAERPYQQLGGNLGTRAPASRADQAAIQRHKQVAAAAQQAALMQWHRNKQQQQYQRQQQIYQIYAPAQLYRPIKSIAHKVMPIERPPPPLGATALRKPHELAQLQNLLQLQGRQLPALRAGGPSVDQSAALLQAMMMMRNDKKQQLAKLRQQQQQRQGGGEHDARLMLNAANLNQANCVYGNSMIMSATAGAIAAARMQDPSEALANYQIKRQQQQQRKQPPPPRPAALHQPLLPIIYNRLVPPARYANDDEGARALLSGSASSESAGSSSSNGNCQQLGSTGLKYASMPLIVDRNHRGQTLARNKHGLLARLHHIDLTLFWWLLLIVCVASLSFVGILSRCLVT